MTFLDSDTESQIGIWEPASPSTVAAIDEPGGSESANSTIQDLHEDRVPHDNRPEPLAPSTARKTTPIMAGPIAQQGLDKGETARNSSLDSALSSLSSSIGGRQSSNSSHTTTQTDAPDVAHLIMTAGSPENVIQQLLKEKQSQAAQNAQLWRLVDKQRAMVLGLNKDLERALKDKERYRKKLKEHIAQISNPSPVDSNPGTRSEPESATSTPRPQEIHIPAPIHVQSVTIPAAKPRGNLPSSPTSPVSPIHVALAPYPITPTQALHKDSGAANLVSAEHRMPSPRAHAYQNYDPESHEATTKQVSTELPYSAKVPPSRSAPNGPPPSAPPPRAPPKTPLPSLTVVEASPNPDQGLQTFPAPPRKGPPAPLRLSNADVSAHLRNASEETDSDYDDILEVDEIPKLERGRRKTREEDDRIREVAAAKEAGLRSQSSKKIVEKEVDEAHVPASPRTAIPIAPPLSHMHRSSPETGSLAGMLSAARSDAIGPKSPGLPLSPRPLNKTTSSSQTPISSPSMSPRLMGFSANMPLSPRAPRQAIPMPPNTPLSMASPKISHPQLQIVSPKLLGNKMEYANSPISPVDARSPRSPNSPIVSSAVFRGFVSDEFPGLLLPPNALPLVDVKVASSRLKPSRASMLFPKSHDDDPVFTLAVSSRAEMRELWRVEKDMSSLVDLDQALRPTSSIAAEMPEKSLFNGHAPAKLDARRTALNKYFGEVVETHLSPTAAMLFCQYLSSNIVAPQTEDGSPVGDLAGFESLRLTSSGRPIRNGYLTKRGKNFGGWKARYFMLDGPIFKYFESPGGPHLGTIKLQNAQIGKQSQASENNAASRNESEDPDNQFRHAFLILEPKRKDSSALVRHVLCAESDRERDLWVDALLQWVDYKDVEDQESTGGVNSFASGSRSQTAPELGSSLLGVSYESMKQGHMPGTPSPPIDLQDKDPMSYVNSPQNSKAISAPKNAQVIQDAGSWGNRHNLMPISQADEKKHRKRSFFGFGTKARPAVEEHATSEHGASLTQMAYDQHGPIRPQFGVPLGEAVKYSHPADVNVELPAVVYRCIEYLDAKGAIREEGIFRLSGSNVVIRQLRDRFNIEGDVNLLHAEPFYDLHAVASLLKLYLRELPTTILTRELHLEFVAVTELSEMAEKTATLNVLVHRLPSANLSLLQSLSRFLITIISHSDINKMTVRNVGIVFSPTLNIPAPVFALFLNQYDAIFGPETDVHGQVVEHTVSGSSLGEGARSPRRQKFQDLPTPSSGHQSFPRAPPAFPQPQHYQPAVQHPTYENRTPTSGDSGNSSKDAHMLTGSNNQNGQSARYDEDQSHTKGHLAASSAAATTKSKRRESSMFGMNMSLGHGPSGPNTKSNLGTMKEGRKSLVIQLNQLLIHFTVVDEETYFD